MDPQQEKTVEISIVIPVYNSEQSLPELTQRIDWVFRERLQVSYEVIFIDDHSPNPNTWPALERLYQEFETVRVIHLQRNFGKTGAILCGFHHVCGNYVVTMDDDLQHYPEDIPALYEQRDHDIVIGKFPAKKHNFFKRLTSRGVNYFMDKLIGKPHDVVNSPFKLIQQNVITNVNRIKTSYPFIPALLFYVTKDAVNVDLAHGDRKYGASGFTLGKMIGQFSNLMINNSSWMLRLISGIGIVAAIISFLLAAYFVFKKFYFGIEVPGWTSLMVVLLFIGGIQILSIGIIGEYLIRIIKGIEQRPPYVIKTDMNHGS